MCGTGSSTKIFKGFSKGIQDIQEYPAPGEEIILWKEGIIMVRDFTSILELANGLFRAYEKIDLKIQITGFKDPPAAKAIAAYLNE